MRIGIDLALFEHLSADEGVPKTKEQLASKAGADSNLIGTDPVKLLSIHTDHEQAVFRGTLPQCV